ncbi:MAG TPA: hypothetical protein VFY24_14230 [Azospira sp.]|nr:hypothetical protein [Azospira sp.]
MPGADPGRASPPATGIDELFAGLCALGESDYAAFVERRASLLRSALATLVAQRGDADELRDLQAEIDRRRAVRVTPDQTLDALLPLLSERVGELKYWVRRLELEAAIATGAPTSLPPPEAATLATRVAPRPANPGD